jgi:hypothetical protein
VAAVFDFDCNKDNCGSQFLDVLFISVASPSSSDFYQFLDVLFISVALPSSSHFYQPTKSFAETVAVLFATQPLATNPPALKLWSSSMLMSTYDRLTACLLWKGQEKKGTLGALQCLSVSVRSNWYRTSVWK